jgi:small subunit ribosomal protein S6
MRHYEIVLLLRVGVGVDMAERYKKMIADSGGALHRFEDWGNRVLAYPLQKQNNAQYLLFNIECGQALLADLRESFRFSEQVLRFLIVSTKGAVTDKSPVLADMERIAKEEAEAAKAEAERPPEAKGRDSKAAKEAKGEKDAKGEKREKSEKSASGDKSDKSAKGEKGEAKAKADEAAAKTKVAEEPKAEAAAKADDKTEAKADDKTEAKTDDKAEAKASDGDKEGK